MTKKTARNNLLYSIVLLVAVLFITVTVIFGWFIMGDSQARDFAVFVANTSGEVGLKINDLDYGAEELLLENSLPLTEYLFELTITSSTSGNIRLSFQNIEGEFIDPEYGAGDMADVMAIRYPTTSETHTVLSELTNNTILSGVPYTSGSAVQIEFILFFHDQPPVGNDINMYQGKTMTIEKLVIEIL